jgi:hypothetical protein
MGNAGRKFCFDKRLRTGPMIMPIKIRNSISGHPVFLKKALAKKPINRMTAARRKAIVWSVSCYHSTLPNSVCKGITYQAMINLVLQIFKSCA